MKKIHTALFLMMIAGCFTQCNEQPGPAKQKHPERKKPAKISYHFAKTKEWMKEADSMQLQTACAVNRTDKANLAKMDSILIPDDLSGDLVFYLPFPLTVPSLQNIHKIIFFSYPAQAFGAYENGELACAGPTNMGRKADPTPAGLYYTNWKAEQTTSTFNDEWDLKWNFNIENKEGIGFHEYALPGYPASHSCLRLQEKDARYLYDWADEWILQGTDSIIAKGTPVLVFGTYNFDGAKPWMQLLTNPHALDISGDFLQQQVAPHLNEMLAEQTKRDSAENSKEGGEAK